MADGFTTIQISTATREGIELLKYDGAKTPEKVVSELVKFALKKFNIIKLEGGANLNDNTPLTQEAMNGRA